MRKFVKWTRLAGSLAACAVTFAATPAEPALTAQAKNDDTHITGNDNEQVLDCNGGTLIVNGTANTITAKGNCWAVTVMGSSNMIVADSVTHDITAYGYNQTVFFHDGDPIIWDRGRELGMTNRLQRVGP